MTGVQTCALPISGFVCAEVREPLFIGPRSFAVHNLPYPLLASIDCTTLDPSPQPPAHARPQGDRRSHSQGDRHLPQASLKCRSPFPSPSGAGHPSPSPPLEPGVSSGDTAQASRACRPLRSLKPGLPPGGNSDRILQRQSGRVTTQRPRPSHPTRRPKLPVGSTRPMPPPHPRQTAGTKTGQTPLAAVAPSGYHDTR